MNCKQVFVASTVLAALGLGAGAQADLVTNGGFESTTMVNGQLAFNSSATGWSVPALNGSYVFLFAPGAADTVGAVGQYGALGLWGPGNGSANGLPASSPAGGNYIASDPSFQNGAISQTLTGLTAGRDYQVSFWWAGAQQYLFDGDTTEGWRVGFGAATQDTSIRNTASHGFSDWMHESFIFTADGTSDVLSFLALGGPNGSVPPFCLLDGASVTAVPIPPAVSLSALGLIGVAGVRVHRARRTSK